MAVSILAKLSTFLVDLIFPRFCVGCDRIGSFLCPNCYAQIPFCALPVKLSLEPSFLDSVTAMAEYGEPISNAIHALKYQGVREVGALCAQLLYQCVDIPPIDVIVSVPLHAKRQAERGFNQSQLIATELGRLLHIPVVPLLTRVKYSAPQARIADRQLRLNHLADCFALNPALTAQHKLLCQHASRILLIDDVCTTGTTLYECAKILKQAGAERVHAVTLAHGA